MASPAIAQPASDATADNDVGDIVVTAQKRSQSINDVGMSIDAATGEALMARGISDTSQLAKIVPGFTFNSTSYGAPVYTIRGVGFQESSLSASPAVSVYVDEVPLPYSAMAVGAALDIERVEVLKGPQGTLYGTNSTGGAINYIAAKPTSSFEAGINASYGRFNTVDVSGYISGPITDTLKARLSARLLQSGDWQQSYTRNDSIGSQDQLFGRLLLDWQPTDKLSVSLNVNGWRDHSESQAQQAIAILSQTVPEDLFPALATSPLAPANARAADWDPGVSFRHDNTFYQGTLRLDYEVTDDVKLSSISSYQSYKRFLPVDADGTQYQSIYFINSGYIDTFYQELRLTGKIGPTGSWIVGGNYESDQTHDNSFLFFDESSTRYIGTLLNENQQNVKTYAAFGSVDVPVTDTVTLTGGLRYTKTERSYLGCSRDIGDGRTAAIFGTAIGACITTLADGSVGEASAQLNQNNLAWRAGLNYKPSRDLLLYANISRGYKAGSFPILSAVSFAQANPVTQESILAYEAGFKASLFDRQLQLNGAFFYYDYSDKQIRGRLPVPIFGALETLVNVPKSHVIGFEASATWRPFTGLTISPSITLVQSKIDGKFVNFTASGTEGDFSGEPFPYTPKWSGNTTVEYGWPVSDSLKAFVGGDVSYQSKTNGSFGQLPDYAVRGYSLLDLRAGVEAEDGSWRASIWGRNVTNEYYWTTAAHFTDTITRYAGMPATYGVSLSYRFK